MADAHLFSFNFVFLLTSTVLILRVVERELGIHLGITADNAAGWAAGAQGRTVEAAQDEMRGIG